MTKTISSTTSEILKALDHASLSACLFAACDLALRASRGGIPTPPDEMTTEQLVRQIVAEMPKRD
jgi:hypothetical protein